MKDTITFNPDNAEQAREMEATTTFKTDSAAIADTSSSPPYSAQVKLPVMKNGFPVTKNGPNPDILLSSLLRTTNEHRSSSLTNRTETDRLRNFLVYTLSLNYRQNAQAALCAEDHAHYIALANTFNDLNDAHDRTHLTANEREQLAPYFWLYLHQPCVALGIPVEAAAQAVLRFQKYLDFSGRYKGSVDGLLHTHGVEALAQKLFMDSTVVMPRMQLTAAQQHDLHLGWTAIKVLYFAEIRGIDGSTNVDEKGSWDYLQTITFRATPRGGAYRRSRAKALGAAESGASLSPAHWASRIEACTRGLLGRKETFAKGKHHADCVGTWKGPEERPKGIPNDSHLIQRPYRWRMFNSTYLPDMFEHRAHKNGCDA